MNPPLFHAGEDVICLKPGPGLTAEGLPCKIEIGHVYTIAYMAYRRDEWICFIVNSDGWAEHQFGPLPLEAGEAVAQLLEEALCVPA